MAASLVTLGEATIVLQKKVEREEITRQDFAEALSRLADYLSREKLESCVWGGSERRLARTVEQVREADDHLTAADVLIAASSLSCEACRYLFTADRVLIESEGVRQLFREQNKGIGEVASGADVARRRRPRYGGNRRPQ